MWQRVSLCLLIGLLANITPASNAKSNPEITRLHIRSDITLRYAHTRVDTRMRNPSVSPQEMTYSINLPENAFICNFSMIVNGELHVADVMEIEDAQETYDQAKKDGLSAGLVSQSQRDSKVFSITVSVEAGEKADFFLTYEEQLERHLNNYEHSISISAGSEVEDFKVEIFIKESLPLLSVRVPEFKESNDVNAYLKTGDDQHTKITRGSGSQSNEATITYTPDKVTKGQLTVHYDVDRKNQANEIQVMDGYFVHFVSPDSMVTIAKHTVFVLDISGSMAGERIKQLKDAMFAILEQMPEHDHFSILTFNTTVSRWEQKGTVSSRLSKTLPPGVYPADEKNKNEAIRFVNSLSVQGSTNINEAMLEGLSLLKSTPERMSMLIFLTDGQPTVGVTNPQVIKQNIKEANTEKIPIFGIAFGRGSDFELMKDISVETKAIARRIYEGSDAALQLEEFFKEISEPVLRDLSVQYVGAEEVSATKKSVLNKGGEYVIVGKLKNDVDTLNFQLLGKGGSGTYEASATICYLTRPFGKTCLPARENPARSEAQKFMKRLYAFKTIKQILGLIDKNAGYSDAEKRRALNLALENNFVTSLTSLVVTGQEGPRVVATRNHSYDTRRNWGPTFSSGATFLSDDDGVGATSISFSFPGLKRRGGQARGGGIRRVAGRGRTTTQVTTTTTIFPAPSVSGCKLLLYASTYLRGQAVEITGHVSDLASLDFSDKLVSLKVEGGCRWEIFQGRDYQGVSKIFISGQSYLGISSVGTLLKNAKSVKRHD